MNGPCTTPVDAVGREKRGTPFRFGGLEIYRSINVGLNDVQRRIVRAFRDHIESQWADDARFRGAARADREDESTLSTRWQATDHVWFEVAIRPLVPQVRVGILTDDRWKSEDWEEKIQESGDTMSEFVEMGFHEAGLEWPEPPVEHYRAELKFFYFATPLELERLEQLDDADIRERVKRMLEGYYRGFEAYLN